MIRLCINKSGFTLIEVIISIAIMGLIMLSFLGMYTHGHRWVFNAGIRTEEIFDNQQELENALAKETTTAGSSAFTMSIDFADITATILIEGDEWSAGNIRAFEPD